MAYWFVVVVVVELDVPLPEHPPTRTDKERVAARSRLESVGPGVGLVA
jgi:hypothetical protein